MPEIDNKTDSSDIPGDQGDLLGVMIENNDGAITYGRNNSRPEKKSSDPTRRCMTWFTHILRVHGYSWIRNLPQKTPQIKRGINYIGDTIASAMTYFRGELPHNYRRR